MGSLSNLYISQSYQSLIHLGTNNTASAALIDLQDGLGNNIGVAVNTAGDLFLSGSLTASLQQGYLYVGGANGKTTAFATSSLVATVNTGSLVTTASFNSYTQSTNIRLNNLESTSASVNVSITNLNSTTSSFATSISNLNTATASLFSSASLGLVTASFSGNTLTFTKGDSSTFGVLIPDVSGSTINTGSFVTTSSFNSYTSSTDNRLNNIETTTASLLVETQNLELFSASALISISNLNSATASLFTSASLALVTASLADSNHAITFTEGDNTQFTLGGFAATGSANRFLVASNQTYLDSGSNSVTQYTVSGSIGYVNSNIDGFFNVSGALSPNPNGRLGGNLLFKIATNATGSLVISGSGNLVMNTPTVNAGFRSQLTNANLAFTLPNISASMTSPIFVSNNIIQSSPTIRGPISASASTIANNYLGSNVTLGTSAANNFEKAITGVSLQNNIINGTISAIANTTNFNTAFSIANSNINQALTINAISSSVQIGNSNMGGVSATINNRASHSFGTNNFLVISSVLTAGQTTVINADGASSTNVTPGVIASMIGGSASTIQLGTPGVTTNDNQLRNSIVLGQTLIVTGSNSAAASNTQGSAFLGRYNSTTVGKNDSSYVVFAVGTGTAAARKTGFLIDSGSNTFVEGTLNVSGSTTMTGSLILSSSNATELTVIGNSEFTGSVKVASTFQLQLPTGSNQQAGTAVLDGANPGTVTVSNSLVTANSIIMLTKQTNDHPNAGPVVVSSKGAGTFTITSNHNNDTDTVGWFIINNS